MAGGDSRARKNRDHQIAIYKTGIGEHRSGALRSQTSTATMRSVYADRFLTKSLTPLDVETMAMVVRVLIICVIIAVGGCSDKPANIPGVKSGWHTVASWADHDNKQRPTEHFHITASEWSISWSCKRLKTGGGFLLVFCFRENVNSSLDNTTTVVDTTSTGSGTTAMRGSGDYSLGINDLFVSYTIRVDEPN